MTEVRQRPKRFNRWMYARPNLYALGQAAALTALLAVLDWRFAGGPDLALRLVYTFALGLVTFDAVWLAQIERGARSVRDANRWRFATTLGWYFFTYMLLCLWTGPGPAALIGAAFGGVLFGAVMAFLPWTDGDPAPMPEGRFDTDRKITGALARRFFYAWHWLVAGLVLWLVLSPPATGWSADYLLFQICLLPWLLRRVPLRSDTASGRCGLLIYLLGMALLVGGLFLF